MSKRGLVDSIEVKNSCSEDWDAMKGSNKVRFCEHCSRHVNNLSALTRKQATKLVRESKGRICVRYVKKADNRPIFAEKLYKITRRAGLTAGVLGASLTISTLTFAQSEPILTKTKDNLSAQTPSQNNSDKNKSEVLSGTVTGVVVDQNGAVIPGAVVQLKNFADNRLQITVTNSGGEYRFENITAGKYSVQASSSGFKERKLEIEILGNSKAESKIELEVAEVSVTVGLLAIVEYSNPLLQAVSNSDLEEVKNLIAKGANVNSKDENYGNITPLFLAVENGDVQIVETLLSFGAKVNMRDELRQTPLMRLDEDATPELVQALLKYGAKINLADKAGNTSLILAARNAPPEVLQILIVNSADLDVQNIAGRTALMEAADADNFENARALIVAGANIFLKDKSGETAWDLTTNDELEALLENYGAERTENR